MKNNNWVRAAMLLALGLIFQSLRMVIPLPPVWSVFIIGTLVNVVLVLAARTVGFTPAMLIAFLMPIIAYMQGQLPMAYLIPVVALGNLVMVYLCARFWGKGIILAAPLFKTFVLFSSTLFVLWVVNVSEQMSLLILFIMGWPQMITGVVGLALAYKLQQRIFVEK